MSEQEKDWNDIFAERKSVSDASRAKGLAEAKAAAEGTDKEIFDREQFQVLYSSLNPDDVHQHTVWENFLSEAEYDYYVRFPDQLTLEEFIKHQKWLDGWG
jgi:hypothetical protein